MGREVCECVREKVREEMTHIEGRGERESGRGTDQKGLIEVAGF